MKVNPTDYEKLNSSGLDQNCGSLLLAEIVKYCISALIYIYKSDCRLFVARFWPFHAKMAEFSQKIYFIDPL